MLINIVVRKVKGGFVASLSRIGGFSAKSGSREGAVGNLVLSRPRVFGRLNVEWDRNHDWTKAHLEGKRRPPGLPYKKQRIDYSQLPKAETPAKAKRILLEEVVRCLPTFADTKVRSSFDLFDREIRKKVTLGNLCRMTETEVLQKRSVSGWRSDRIGPKTLEVIKHLLRHYGLRLKQK